MDYECSVASLYPANSRLARDPSDWRTRPPSKANDIPCAPF